MAKPTSEIERVNLGVPGQILEGINNRLASMTEAERFRFVKLLQESAAQMEALQEADRTAHIQEAFGGE